MKRQREEPGTEKLAQVLRQAADTAVAGQPGKWSSGIHDEKGVIIKGLQLKDPTSSAGLVFSHDRFGKISESAGRTELGLKSDFQRALKDAGFPSARVFVHSTVVLRKMENGSHDTGRSFHVFIKHPLTVQPKSLELLGLLQKPRE